MYTGGLANSLIGEHSIVQHFSAYHVTTPVFRSWNCARTSIHGLDKKFADNIFLFSKVATVGRQQANIM